MNSTKPARLKPATLVLLIFFALALTPGCFVRHRAVTPSANRKVSPVLIASREELLQRLHNISAPLMSFLMNADLSPSVLDPAKGTATDYATVSAYVLFRKPDDIRILGRDPVIGSTIFDMVSNSSEFRVSIPTKKRFIVGSNTAPATSGNKLENLRPQALVSSLIVSPPDPKTDWALMENDVERALYILLIIHRDNVEPVLVRQVYFDGHTLQIARQKTFDASGLIVSDARYSDWKVFDGVAYPATIDIQRPKDNYEVQLSVVNMKINTPDVTDEKFTLKQPPEYEVRELK